MTNRRKAIRWFPETIGLPHPSVPMLIADSQTWAAWRGSNEPEEITDAFDGELGVVEVGGSSWACMGYTGGEFQVAVGQADVIVLQSLSCQDDEDYTQEIAMVRDDIVNRRRTEYLTGEIEVTGLLVLGDAWNKGVVKGTSASEPRVIDAEGDGSGHLFMVPLPPGRYLVLEGSDDDDPDVIWLRFRQGNPQDYQTRPEKEEEAEESERVCELLHELEHVRISGKNFESERSKVAIVRELIELGGAKSIEERCNELTSNNPFFATWLQVLLLSATEGNAASLLEELAREWLTPASSAEAANQVLTRKQLLEGFSAVPTTTTLEKLRKQVEAAPEPEVFVPDGDFF